VPQIPLDPRFLGVCEALVRSTVIASIHNAINVDNLKIGVAIDGQRLVEDLGLFIISFISIFYLLWRMICANDVV
jgi:hypothetical protein